MLPRGQRLVTRHFSTQMEDDRGTVPRESRVEIYQEGTPLSLSLSPLTRWGQHRWPRGLKEAPLHIKMSEDVLGLRSHVSTCWVLRSFVPRALAH